jgi:hypothetical protein
MMNGGFWRDARAAKLRRMSTRLRLRTSAKKPRATVRAFDINSMLKKPPARSARQRRLAAALLCEWQG